MWNIFSLNSHHYSDKLPKDLEKNDMAVYRSNDKAWIANVLALKWIDTVH